MRDGEQLEAAGDQAGETRLLLRGDQEVVAQGDHHADRVLRRRDRVDQGRREELSLALVAAQGEHLLELIDDEEHSGSAAEIAQVAGQEVGPRGQLRAEILDRRAGAIERPFEGRDRMRAGPDRENPPVGAQHRDDAGLEERGLADPGGPDHGDQRLDPQPVDEGVDLALAAEEELGVLAGEREEGAVRVTVAAQRGGAGHLVAEAVLGEPGPHRFVAALEAVRLGDQAGPVGATAGQEEHLLRAIGRRRGDLRGGPERDDRVAVGVDQHHLVRPERLPPDDRDRPVEAVHSHPRLGAARAPRDEPVLEERLAGGQQALHRLATGRDRRLVGPALGGGQSRQDLAERVARARGMTERDQLGHRVGVGPVEERRGEHANQVDPLARLERSSPERRDQVHDPGRIAHIAGEPVAAGERDDADVAGEGANQREHRLAQLTGRAARQARKDLGQRRRAAGGPQLTQGAVDGLGRRRARFRAGGDARCEGELLRQIEDALLAQRRSLCHRAAQDVVEARREVAAEHGDRSSRVRRGHVLEALRGERGAAGQALVGQRAERVDVGRDARLGRLVPQLRRHVGRRSEQHALGRELARYLAAVAERRRRARSRPRDCDGLIRLHGRQSRQGRVALRAGGRQVDPGAGCGAPVAPRQDRRHGRRRRLGDAEVEQLGQQAAGARHHHDVARLQIAVDDALLVSGLDHLADALEEGDEPLEGNPPLGLEPAGQRDAAHQLHGDPQEAVRLGAEGVDVGGVRVVEARGEARLAEEPLGTDIGPAGECLDDRLALERRLLGPVDLALTAGAEELADDEVPQSTAGDRLPVRFGALHARPAGRL